MKFERGKSTRDPIYLRKPTGEYWMEGDVYENLCSCLTQIFGQRNFFIDSFTPKFGLSDEKFYTVAVTDKDGDTHGFVARVVNAEEFDRTQRGGRFREEVHEISPDNEKPVGESVQVDESNLFDTIENPDEDLEIDEEQLKLIKEQLKQEREIEGLNAEMEREEKIDIIGDGDDLTKNKSEDKPKRRRGRKQK